VTTPPATAPAVTTPAPVVPAATPKPAGESSASDLPRDGLVVLIGVLLVGLAVALRAIRARERRIGFALLGFCAIYLLALAGLVTGVAGAAVANPSAFAVAAGDGKKASGADHYKVRVYDARRCCNPRGVYVNAYPKAVSLRAPRALAPGAYVWYVSAHVRPGSAVGSYDRLNRIGRRFTVR
jgi:hypothetical protein